MLETFMKLRRRFLQLHPRSQAIKGRRPPTDEAVNLFLDVAGRLFHDVFSIGRTTEQRKDAEKAGEEKRGPVIMADKIMDFQKFATVENRRVKPVDNAFVALQI